MSDSASKKDVEDVLSSVRRLVSSEVPRNQRPDLPEGPGALVLTDAQRIERPVSKGQAAKSLEDRIAELEAAVSTREDEYEPDGSEDQLQHRPDRIVYTRPPTSSEDADARGNALRLSKLALVVPGSDAVDGTETDDSNPHIGFRHAAPSQPTELSAGSETEQEAPMAEDVTAPPREKADIHPFKNPDDMISRFEARIENGDTNGDTVAGPGHNGFSDTPESFEIAADAQTPSEADVESAPSQPDAEIADEVSDEMADAAFEQALAEAVSDQIVASEEVVSEAESVAAAPGLVVGKDASEADRLRPIVAKLIREELKGDLGERITRNMRKLVRREIMRVINTREFE